MTISLAIAVVVLTCWVYSLHGQVDALREIVMIMNGRDPEGE